MRRRRNRHIGIGTNGPRITKRRGQSIPRNIAMKVKADPDLHIATTKQKEPRMLTKTTNQRASLIRNTKPRANIDTNTDHDRPQNHHQIETTRVITETKPAIDPDHAVKVPAIPPNPKLILLRIIPKRLLLISIVVTAPSLKLNPLIVHTSITVIS